MGEGMVQGCSFDWIGGLIQKELGGLSTSTYAIVMHHIAISIETFFFFFSFSRPAHPFSPPPHVMTVEVNLIFSHLSPQWKKARKGLNVCGCRIFDFFSPFLLFSFPSFPSLSSFFPLFFLLGLMHCAGANGVYVLTCRLQAADFDVSLTGDRPKGL